MSDGFKVQLERVPPPDKAPVHQVAETLGLCDGLRVERKQRQYRCGCCYRMQQPGSWQVWVPDGTQLGDPAWSVTERAREFAYNGEWTAWCLQCALKLSPPKLTAAAAKAQMVVATARSWWRRFFHINAALSSRDSERDKQDLGKEGSS